MTGSDPPDRLVYRLCMVTLAGASRVVPAYRRFEWRREWEAELWHRVESLSRRGELSAPRQMNLMVRCADAFRHAAWLRGRSVTRHTRSALQELGTAPVRSGGIIAGLALAMGAGGAVFGLAWAALLRPASASLDGRVVRVWNVVPAAEMDRTALSSVEFTTFQSGNTTLEHIAAFRRARFQVEGPTAFLAVQGAFVTSEFFDVFGRRLEPQGAVLGYDLWLRRFAGDSSVLGQTITIDDIPYRIGGIAPLDFRFPRNETELWLPFTPSVENPGARNLAVVALLRPGVAREEARRDLVGLSESLQRRYPETYFARFGTTWELTVDPLERPGTSSEPMLLVLLVAATLAVVTGVATACSVAFTGCALDARRSLDPVAAVIYVGCASTVAVAVCAFALARTSSLVESWMPALGSLRIGAPELAFIAVTGSLTLGGMMIGGRRWHAGGPGGALLLGVAVASTVILLAGGAAFERSYVHLLEDGAGFRDAGLIVIPSTGDAGQMLHWRDRLADILGADVVAGSTSVPYVEGAVGTTFDRAGVHDSNPTPATSAAVQLVQPEYFVVMGIGVKGGRWLRSDRREAVVSASMAHRFWPGGDALGQRIAVYVSIGRRPEPVTVVGVAEDVRRKTLGGAGMAELYLPLFLDPGRAPSLVVRTSLLPERVADLLGGALAGAKAVALSARVSGARAPHRGISLALCSLALLAAVSVMFFSYHSSRLARQSAAQGALLGALSGALVAWWVAPAVSELLYRTSMRDHLALLEATIVAGGLSAAAALLSPAERLPPRCSISPSQMAK